MRAKFHGMEVEGTPEEILKIKDELDKREEVKHNYKITVCTHPVYHTGTAVADHIIDLMKRYPNHTYI